VGIAANPSESQRRRSDKSPSSIESADNRSTLAEHRTTGEYLGGHIVQLISHGRRKQNPSLHLGGSRNRHYLVVVSANDCRARGRVGDTFNQETVNDRR
jgi:hypothetical protein